MTNAWITQTYPHSVARQVAIYVLELQLFCAFGLSCDEISCYDIPAQLGMSIWLVQ